MSGARVGARVAVMEPRSAMYGRIGTVIGFRKGSVRVDLDEAENGLDQRLLFDRQELRVLGGVA